MIKKIICLGVVLVMIVSFFGCNQGKKLDKYKETANLEIENYAESKGQDNYAIENWAIISRIVTEGRLSVDAAMDKDKLDSVVKTAKLEIDEIPQKEEDSLELQIRQDFLDKLQVSGKSNITLNDIEILKNYGIYSDCVVVKMNRGAYPVVTVLNIAGVTFNYKDSNTALVWLDGQFFELEEAYNQEFLTKADLIVIANIQNKSGSVPRP